MEENEYYQYFGIKDKDTAYYLGVEAFNKKDYETAFKWFEIAAEKDHPEAEYLVGICYQSGLGVPVNMEAALKSFIAAAYDKHPDASRIVGDYFLHGRAGMKICTKTAEYWYKLAETLQNDKKYNEKLIS
jgi:TPR repeat protein